MPCEIVREIDTNYKAWILLQHLHREGHIPADISFDRTPGINDIASDQTPDLLFPSHEAFCWLDPFCESFKYLSMNLEVGHSEGS